jgi:hypothetical protein
MKSVVDSSSWFFVVRMMDVWSDAVAKLRTEMFRALAARMLVETDPVKLKELVEQLGRIVNSGN